MKVIVKYSKIYPFGKKSKPRFIPRKRISICTKVYFKEVDGKPKIIDKCEYSEVKESPEYSVEEIESGIDADNFTKKGKGRN